MEAKPKIEFVPQPFDYSLVTNLLHVLTGQSRIDEAENKYYRDTYTRYEYHTELASIKSDRRVAAYRRAVQGDQLHRAVGKLVALNRPHDWHRLVMEYPTIATLGKVEYFRNERDLLDGKRTVSTIFKYFTRHFKGLIPDHVMRDVLSMYTADSYGYTNDPEKMVEVVQKGPCSCMQWSHVAAYKHPYLAYRPEFGWGMAYLTGEDGEYLSRCLVHHHPETGRKTFVTAYGDHSTVLTSHLRDTGYDWIDGWDDAYIDASGVVPYVDGDANCVESLSPKALLECEGISLDLTSGEANVSTCESCGERTDSDDLTTVYNGDCVCDDCLSSDYTRAFGRHGEADYYRDEECVEASGEWYVLHHIHDNDVVELDDGDYAHIDDAIFVEDLDGYVLRDSAYYCEADGMYYSSKDAAIDAGAEESDEDEDEEEEDEDVPIPFEPSKGMSTLHPVNLI